MRRTTCFLLLALVVTACAGTRPEPTRAPTAVPSTATKATAAPTSKPATATPVPLPTTKTPSPSSTSQPSLKSLIVTFQDIDALLNDSYEPTLVEVDSGMNYQGSGVVEQFRGAYPVEDDGAPITIVLARFENPETAIKASSGTKQEYLKEGVNIVPPSQMWLSVWMVETNDKHLITGFNQDDFVAVIYFGLVGDVSGDDASTIVGALAQRQAERLLGMPISANVTPFPTRTPRATPIPSPTRTPAPLPTQPLPTIPPPTQPPAAVCECGSNLYNCGDFSTQAGAQACYNYCFPIAGDVHDLDRDGDGRVCESLPLLNSLSCWGSKW